MVTVYPCGVTTSSVWGPCRGAGAPSTPAPTGEATPAVSDQASEPAASVETPLRRVKAGEQLTAGPWGFTVREVTVEKEAPGQIPPPSGKELMFVQVELFNSGTETLEIKPGQFSMKDSSGAEVKTFGKRQAYNALDMSPLEPNCGTTTAFICAVDPGSTGFVFTFTHEVDGQKTPLEVSVR